MNFTQANSSNHIDVYNLISREIRDYHRDWTGDGAVFSLSVERSHRGHAEVIKKAHRGHTEVTGCAYYHECSNSTDAVTAAADAVTTAIAVTAADAVTAARVQFSVGICWNLALT